MSANIDSNVLKNFLVHTLNVDKISKTDAIKYDIKTEKFNEADVDENNYIDIDEIIDDKNLYEKFAALYVEEHEKASEAKDEEKQKEEQTKVKDKSDAKA